MPLTSTIDSIVVPFSRVSGSLLRHTRWMVSHSLKRDRSDAHSQAFSGGSGTSTETDSFAILADTRSPCCRRRRRCLGAVGGTGALSAAFLAASCTLSTVSWYLPCVFSSTISPALSIASPTLSTFFSTRSLALSRNAMTPPFLQTAICRSPLLSLQLAPQASLRLRRAHEHLPCIHHSASIAAAPANPMAIAIDGQLDVGWIEHELLARQRDGEDHHVGQTARRPPTPPATTGTAGPPPPAPTTR